MAPTNPTIAAALERIATLLEREGKEPTSISAFRHASRAVARAPRPAAELVEEGGVEALHELGIGYQISGHITDWVRHQNAVVPDRQASGLLQRRPKHGGRDPLDPAGSHRGSAAEEEGPVTTRQSASGCILELKSQCRPRRSRTRFAI